MEAYLIGAACACFTNISFNSVSLATVDFVELARKTDQLITNNLEAQTQTMLASPEIDPV